jgi:Bacteriodetes cell division protein (FtsL-like)
MNRLISDIEKEKQEQATAREVMENIEPKAVKPASKVKKGFLSIISGGFLAEDSALSSLPFLLFIAFLGVLYIANGYYAHNRLKELDSLDNNITELRTQYIIAKDKLMNLSKESEVNKSANAMGIKESVVPPEKIMVYNTAKKK